jgi:hypothetical protein
MGDDLLEQSRDFLLATLMGCWGELGWTLAEARTTADVRQAFSPICVDPYNQPWLRPFVRETDAQPSRATLRATRLALSQAGQRELDLQQRHRELRDEFRVLDQAQELVTSAEDAEALRSEGINTQRSLEETETQLAQTQADQSRLRRTVEDVEAALAQAELLAFVQLKRYEHTPRNVAFAMAGLPNLGWWQSFRRCATLTRPQWPSRDFHVFRLIKRCLKKGNNSPEAFLDDLRHRILALKRSDPALTSVRAFLCDRWRYLRLAALESDLDKGTQAARLPYVIYGHFRQMLAKETAVDRILAKREKLDS